jgi:hypothetical protein
MRMRAIFVVCGADDAMRALLKVLISSVFLQCQRNALDNVPRVRRVHHRAVFASR